MSTIGDLAAAYGVTEAEIEQRAYAMAEQLHDKYCLTKGIVNHSEMRPDYDVSLTILKGLAAGDWFLFRAPKPAPAPDLFYNFGDDTVLGAWADDDKA